MIHRKPLEDLTIADDFMFNKVMGKTELAKAFLEDLFQKTIVHIEKHETQATHDDDYSSRSVRFDVEFVGDGTVHDIEMQQSGSKGVKSLGDLLRRTRYYQSCIDRAYLDKGDSWRDLPPSKVIFICTYDPFGDGLSEYHQVPCLRGSGRELNNGTEVVYLNSTYTTSTSTRSIREFLDYVKNPGYFRVVKSEWVRSMHNEVCLAKTSPENRRDLMSLYEWGQLEREEGREEGRKEALDAAVNSLSKKLGISLDEAKRLLDIGSGSEDCGRSGEGLERSRPVKDGVQMLDLGSQSARSPRDK